MFGKQKPKIPNQTKSPFTSQQASGGFSVSSGGNDLQLHTMQDDLQGKKGQNISVFPTGKKAAFEKSVFSLDEKDKSAALPAKAPQPPKNAPASNFGTTDAPFKKDGFIEALGTDSNAEGSKQSQPKVDDKAQKVSAPPAGLPVQKANPPEATLASPKDPFHIAAKKDVSAPKDSQVGASGRSIYTEGPFSSTSAKGQDKPSPSQPASQGASKADGSVKVSMFGKGLSDPTPISKDVSRSGAPGSIKVSKVTSRTTRIFFHVLLGIIIVALFAGAYYYWLTRMRGTLEDSSILPAIDTSQLPGSDAQEVFPYDFERPNPIILGDEGSLDPIQAISSVKETWNTYDDEDGTLEFFFVDGSGEFDAISAGELLSRLGIQIDGDRTAALLGEESRVYLYKDRDGIRIVLSLALQNREQMQTLMRQEEAKIIGELTPILAGTANDFSLQGDFHDSQYRSYAIRFANSNVGTGNSVDYTFRRNTLLIGTSKDSLRAVLDKLDGIGSGAAMTGSESAGNAMMTEDQNAGDAMMTEDTAQGSAMMEGGEQSATGSN